ncbi:hypothetical protein [Endozoicomonas atrinae]|uniref:hypothetical protein n=1 Tax=Endozoicomonas atrinae TaxID=1333660 RepID=UPI000ACD7868|nr:hypothetical protein [Endozoicomonas atrinae]
MSTPISRSVSVNNINSFTLEESLPQAQKCRHQRSSQDSLFHGRSTREHSKANDISTFRMENEIADHYNYAIQARSIEPRNELDSSQINTVEGTCQSHVIHSDNVTTAQSKMATDRSGACKRLLSPENLDSSPSQRRPVRDAFVINMQTFGSTDSLLPHEGSEPTCLRNSSWWNRNKKWNYAFVAGSLLVASAVVISFTLDKMNVGDKTLFQRSGSVIVSWAMLTAFITLRKRGEKLPSHELMIEAASDRLSRREDIKFMDLLAEMENAMISTRKVKRAASESDWVILLASIIGTLIWGYGDLFFK